MNSEFFPFLTIFSVFFLSTPFLIHCSGNRDRRHCGLLFFPPVIAISLFFLGQQLFLDRDCLFHFFVSLALLLYYGIMPFGFLAEKRLLTFRFSVNGLSLLFVFFPWFLLPLDRDFSTSATFFSFLCVFHGFYYGLRLIFYRRIALKLVSAFMMINSVYPLLLLTIQFESFFLLFLTQLILLFFLKFCKGRK